MKTYVEVELKAKNAPTGSYAAGCPVNVGDNGGPNDLYCRRCEVTR